MLATRRFQATKDLQDSGYSGLVLSRLAKHVCRVADVDRSCIFVRDRSDPRSLIAAAAHGTPIEFLGTRVGADEGVLGRVLSTGEPLLDARRSRRRSEPISQEFGEGARRAAFAPIHFEGAVRGVVGIVVGRRAQAASVATRSSCSVEMAEMAAAALDHASSRDDDATPSPRTSTRSPPRWTCATSAPPSTQRTSCCSPAWSAGLLQLDAPALVELEFAARLHDVGKIRVPDAILNKPGPLDPHEREIMRCHSAWGAETLCGRARASRSSRRSSASTTSAGTATATRTGWPARASRSPAASSPSATPSAR